VPHFTVSNHRRCGLFTPGLSFITSDCTLWCVVRAVRPPCCQVSRLAALFSCKSVSKLPGSELPGLVYLIGASPNFVGASKTSTAPVIYENNLKTTFLRDPLFGITIQGCFFVAREIYGCIYKELQCLPSIGQYWTVSTFYCYIQTILALNFLFSRKSLLQKLQNYLND